jgi:hypothetical protein
MQSSVHATQDSGDDSPSVRLHYLDWLRVLATLGVFLYHATRPFDLQDWLIKNEEQSALVTLFFLIFLGTWGMPLFFLVSGAGSQFALRKRSGRQFAKERFNRLFIPFVVGSILIHPFQEFLKWVHKGRYDGAFFDSRFFAQYIDSRPGPSPKDLINPDALHEYLEFLQPTVFIKFGEHLWFLGFLFSFSLIALPVFLWLKRDMGRRFISWLARVCEIRGGIFLFILPPALVRLVLQPRFPQYTNWSDFIFMLVFFLYGYILYDDDRFQRIIRRDWRLAVTVGSINTAVIVSLLVAGIGVEWVTDPAEPGFYLAWSLLSVNAWCWVFVMLYIGMSVMNVRNKWLDYGQDAIMPFYLFHHPVIIIIAFVVVEWELGMTLKMAFVVLSSFALTSLIYLVFFRRIKPLRKLLGMKMLSRIRSG